MDSPKQDKCGIFSMNLLIDNRLHIVNVITIILYLYTFIVLIVYSFAKFAKNLHFLFRQRGKY